MTTLDAHLHWKEIADFVLKPFEKRVEGHLCCEIFSKINVNFEDGKSSIQFVQK